MLKAFELIWLKRYWWKMTVFFFFLMVRSCTICAIPVTIYKKIMVLPLTALHFWSAAWQQECFDYSHFSQIWSALSKVYILVYIFQVPKKYFQKTTLKFCDKVTEPISSLHTILRLCVWFRQLSTAVTVGEDRLNGWWGTHPGGRVSKSCAAEDSRAHRVFTLCRVHHRIKGRECTF